MLASGADDVVLALCLGQAQDGTAGGALAVNMRFSVPKTVAPQAEKSAEALVFSPPLRDVAREHACEDDDDQHRGKHEINDARNSRHPIGEKERGDRVDDHHGNVHPKQGLIQRIGSVPTVKESADFVFENLSVYRLLYLCVGFL